MLDKSFCAKPDKWVWPTTVAGIYGGSDEDRTRCHYLFRDNTRGIPVFILSLSAISSPTTVTICDLKPVE